MYHDKLPAPNPIMFTVSDAILTYKLPENVVKRNVYDADNIKQNMWNYFEDNRKLLVYQRMDNYPWSMIPLNNMRFAAALFFDCKKLIALGGVSLHEFPTMLYKHLYPPTMKAKESKPTIQLQDTKNYKGLRFDSRFESGNLLCAYRVGPHEYDLLMQNDTNSKGHTQWFYFSVEHMQQGQEVTFNIINFVKNDSLFNQGQRPVSYSVKTKQWIKSAYSVAYYRNKFRRENSTVKTYYTLTFSYTFKYSHDKVYFAQCYPYTYGQLNQLCDKHKDNPHLIQKELCKTITRLSCPLLVIGKAPKSIVLLGRQHPGETPGSYAMEGAIEFLLGNSKEAEALRKNYTFYIIPMLNPDGVVYGNYRCNLSGVDLNRIWSTPHRELHDSVWHVRELIKSIEPTIELVIDLHGHSKKLNGFFYGNNGSNQQKLFPLIASTISKYLSFADCCFSSVDAKRNTARVALQQALSIGMTYTLEISFHAYRDGGVIDFTEQSYKQIGIDVMLSIFKLNEQNMTANQKLPSLLSEQLNNQVQEILKQDLNQLANNEGDSGSDSNPEEDDLLDSELNSVLQTNKIIKFVIIKKRIMRTDKQTQTELTYQSSLILDDKVLQSIEDQVKSSRQPHVEQYFEFNNLEGMHTQGVQTDLSLQQILGKMQIFHVRLTNKHQLMQQQQQHQNNNKPMVILLKNPYQRTIDDQLTHNKQRRNTSIRGRSSLEYSKFSGHKQYSVQATPERKLSSFAYPYSPQNMLLQDATFEKIANISKIKFRDKPVKLNKHIKSLF